MKKSAVLLLVFLISFVSKAQVKNTSYQTASGEKVLRLEFTVPLDKRGAWQLFTNDAQMKRWMAPQVHIDLKSGGTIITNYDSTKSLSDSSSIKLPIVNYLEGELLTLQVILNDHFPKQQQQEDEHLQEVIQFLPVSPGKTKIVSSMIGWGKGEGWNKTYDFFVKGNTWTYEELLKLFK